MMPGEEFSDMWGVVFTFLLPLELALNHGQPFHGKLPFELHTVPPENYANTSEILSTTAAYAGELLKILTMRHREITACEGKNNPDPYVSALLRGGTPGKDRLLGGPRYHTVNVDAFALVNTADAITAIDQVVFQHRSHTLAELVAAAINNFSGQEALRLELLTAPKYGNDNAEADQNVRKLAARFAAIVRDCSDDKMIYMPSFHTLNAHVGAGASWGAGLDGRLAGEPFAKNIGPMQGRNKNGITSVITSATAIEQEFFYGGQALDLHVDAGLFDAYSDRVKLQAALQTYFKQGGLLIQINGVKVDTLKRALVNPEMYADLIVRIGGYSTRFVLLSREIQREMIKRFESHT
jgi:pyruvate-formate lyase